MQVHFVRISEPTIAPYHAHHLPLKLPVEILQTNIEMSKLNLSKLLKCRNSFDMSKLLKLSKYQNSFDMSKCRNCRNYFNIKIVVETKDVFQNS